MPPEFGWADTEGYGDDNLKETLSLSLGEGADAGLPDPVRFLSGVGRLIEKLRPGIASRAPTDAPAIFVLGQPSEEPDLSLRVVPMLGNGLTAVEGHVWFVGPVVNYGRGLFIENWSDDLVFERVSDLGLGERPAIVFETRTSPVEAWFYPNGLDAPDDFRPVRLGGAPIGLIEVLAVIDHIYETQLITSTVRSRARRLWQNPRQYWVARDAEDAIQDQLRAGLTGAFSSCVIRHEQDQATGRLDLEIEEPNPEDRSIVVRHAILELKVLRKFGESGNAYSDEETKDWIESGVIQAFEYREERGSRASALCCFDMRPAVTGSTCFAHVQEMADELAVTLRVWHIFTTPAQLRRYRRDSREHAGKA